MHRTLLHYVHSLIGQRVEIVLHGERSLAGRMIDVDLGMNLVLEDFTFIPARSIKFISVMGMMVEQETATLYQFDGDDAKGLRQ